MKAKMSFELESLIGDDGRVVGIRINPGDEFSAEVVLDYVTEGVTPDTFGVRPLKLSLGDFCPMPRRQTA